MIATRPLGKHEAQDSAVPQTDSPTGPKQLSTDPLTSNIVPLNDHEKARLVQLECSIEKGLSTFLSVARCFAEIRSRRLYRDRYHDFQTYVKERFALSRSSVDGMIRSAQTAELLEANGAHLPDGISEAAVRPLNALGNPDLQKASWNLVRAVCPDRVPTQPVVSKIVRIIRNAIEPVNRNGSEHPSRERPFVQAAQRLAVYDGFDAMLVVAHIGKLPSAWRIHMACGQLIDRCAAVRNALVDRFPELDQPND